MKRALAIGLGSLLIASGAAAAANLQREQAACQDDAMRLCSPYVPDHAKIHSCLLAYKASISPACRAIVAPAGAKHRKRR